MKIGVIGAGYWGKKHVHDYLELGAKPIVADLIKENREHCRENFGVEVMEDYHDLLSDPEVEGVSICTPNQTHYTICKEALLADKHVLLEKPMTLDSGQAMELVEIAKSRKRVLAVGHVFRFNNALRKIKEMLKENAFGDVYIVKLTWTNLEPIFEDRDILFDLAPHPFDIVHFLFDTYPTEISCIGGAYRREGGEEAAYVNCMINHTIVNLEISWITPIKSRTLTIVGEKKSAFVDCLSQKIETFGDTRPEREELQVTPTNSLVEELRHFLECIKNENATSVADGEVGVKIIKMIETARRSLLEKRVIKLIV
jgi:predicted dehydrogenase